MEDLLGSRRNTAADASDQMGRLNDSQLEQFRLGDRTRLADEIYGNKSGVKRWGDASQPINGNDARADLLRTIHGNEAADQLSSRATGGSEAHLTYTEVFVNTETTTQQPARQYCDVGKGNQ